MNVFDVLERPILSEKSHDVRDKFNKYSFVVSKTASKQDVKLAVERLYDVKVENVRTLIVRGKYRRRGMYAGKPQNFKKALVTLKQGEKLPLFEDQ
jgi:large subunit ribosomal protein L23